MITMMMILLCLLVLALASGPANKYHCCCAAEEYLHNTKVSSYRAVTVTFPITVQVGEEQAQLDLTVDARVELEPQIIRFCKRHYITQFFPQIYDKAYSIISAYPNKHYSDVWYDTAVPRPNQSAGLPEFTDIVDEGSNQDDSPSTSSSTSSSLSSFDVVAWQRDEPLEYLAYKYGTDKSKDDHKYVDIYASLFSPSRFDFMNVMEIGVAAGQSIQLWNDFFPRANIFAMDFQIRDAVLTNLQRLQRVKILLCNALVASEVDVALANYIEKGELGQEQQAAELMDLIIDDANHERYEQELVLANTWRFLKPGGHYVIEDVDAQSDGLDFELAPELLMASTRHIFRDNHVAFIDCAVGHRNWEHYKESSGVVWTRDRRVHNSYMIVIRKRVGAVPPIRSATGVLAMLTEQIVPTI